MKFYSIIFPLQFKCVVDHLSGDRATGNGSGVQVVLTTSTGCVHGGDGVGSPKRDPTELGRSAAEMALKSAAKVCVDQHMQVRAISVVVSLSCWLLMGADDPGSGLALVLKVCSKSLLAVCGNVICERPEMSCCFYPPSVNLFLNKGFRLLS